MNIKNYSPIIKQYFTIKLKYPNMIIFYRVGDFYEFFFEDAYKVSKLLNLNISKKGISKQNPVPMAGIPYYVLNNYIIKLINLGESLVICEQVENNEITKKYSSKLIKRKVSKIITPGTLTEEFLLSNTKDNLIACLYKEKNIFSYSTLNIISGDFYVYKIKNIDQLKIKLNITNPNELLYSENFLSINILKNIKCIKKISLSNFNINDNLNILKKQFNTYDLSGFGINNNDICIKSAGYLLQYIKNIKIKSKILHINKLSLKQDKDYLILDKLTIKKLNINGNNDSLLFILNKTNTYMGNRLLKRWILNPIKNISIIKNRQNSIESLMLYEEDIKYYLKNINDLERIIGRLAILSIKVKDLINLNNSIKQFKNLKKILFKINNNYINSLNNKILNYKNINKLLSKSIIDNNEQIIANGFNYKLDQLRILVNNKSNFIDLFETKEKNRLNISTLKIKFSNINGYYIQINKKFINAIPQSYIRIQSLKNYNRYITNDLKNIEIKLITAKTKIYLLEKKILNKIINFISHYLQSLLLTSKAIAELDVLTNLAERAKNLNYFKPNFTTKNIIRYSKGRHPVMEYNKSFPFISNSLLISDKCYNSIILTGPNMGGKSTYLRQTALIVLMAYIGSFVPAKYAIIGPIDRIFIRLGSTDNPTSGKSTFMVEMNEISNIVNNATKNSLVLIDEIGRGTSTNDGIALAWSILLYLSKYIKCLTIFSTHFFEIIYLEKIYSKIRNMYFYALKINKKIIFNYTIKYGFIKKSYGLTVAKIAGLPKKIINIAKKKILLI